MPSHAQAIKNFPFLLMFRQIHDCSSILAARNVDQSKRLRQVNPSQVDFKQKMLLESRLE